MSELTRSYMYQSFPDNRGNETVERDQLQTSYNTLTEERDQLQTSYNTLTEERDQLQKERDDLMRKFSNLSELT
jgi:uncharacterized coiled-coil DUF342 family protein